MAVEVERARAVHVHPVADELAGQLAAAPRRLVREEGVPARPGLKGAISQIGCWTGRHSPVFVLLGSCVAVSGCR